MPGNLPSGAVWFMLHLVQRPWGSTSTVRRSLVTWPRQWHPVRDSVPSAVDKKSMGSNYDPILGITCSPATTFVLVFVLAPIGSSCLYHESCKMVIFCCECTLSSVKDSFAPSHFPLHRHLSFLSLAVSPSLIPPSSQRLLGFLFSQCVIIIWNNFMLGLAHI